MQYDAFDLGFVTTDDFTNGEILDTTYPAVQKKLEDDFRERPAMPIVTGFLARVSAHAFLSCTHKVACCWSHAFQKSLALIVTLASHVYGYRPQETLQAQSPLLYPSTHHLCRACILTFARQLHRIVARFFLRLLPPGRENGCHDDAGPRRQRPDGDRDRQGAAAARGAGVEGRGRRAHHGPAPGGASHPRALPHIRGGHRAGLLRGAGESAAGGKIRSASKARSQDSVYSTAATTGGLLKTVSGSVRCSCAAPGIVCRGLQSVSCDSAVLACTVCASRESAQHRVRQPASKACL